VVGGRFLVRCLCHVLRRLVLPLVGVGVRLLFLVRGLGVRLTPGVSFFDGAVIY
jgi:hypothetical protein